MDDRFRKAWEAFYCARTMYSRARGNNNNPVTHVRETHSWNKYDSGSRLSTGWPTLTARTRTTIPVSWSCEVKVGVVPNNDDAVPNGSQQDGKIWLLVSLCANKLDVLSIWPRSISLTEIMIYYDAKSYTMLTVSQNLVLKNYRATIMLAFGCIPWREDPTCRHFMKD